MLRFAVIEKQGMFCFNVPQSAVVNDLAAKKWETEPAETSPLISQEEQDEPSRNPIIVLLTSTRLPVTLLSMVLVSLLHPALEAVSCINLPTQRSELS